MAHHCVPSKIRFNFIHNKYEIRSKIYTQMFCILKMEKINTNIYQDITKCQKRKRNKRKQIQTSFWHNISKTMFISQCSSNIFISRYCLWYYSFVAWIMGNCHRLGKIFPGNYSGTSTHSKNLTMCRNNSVSLHLFP